MVRTAGKVALALLLVSCGTPTTSDNNSNPTPGPTNADLRASVLSNLATGVIVPQYEDFASKAATLKTATAAWAEADTAQTREVAQQAWRDAMSSWQRAELFQVGPAGIMGQVAGGEDLRDQIYSWPLTSPCRVDQEVVSQDYQTPGTFFAEERINVRGLDALEYVLFKTGDQNACSAASGINTSGDWRALSEADLDARRADYAAALATDIDAKAQSLVEHWSPSGQNFVGELSNAGNGSTTYASSQEALNAISDALFYLEKETKDMKLAIPAGVSNCDADTCPEDRESLHANFSREKMLENVHAFRAGFTGGDKEGFDDLLVDVGAKDLSDQMISQIDKLETALQGWSGPLDAQLATDPAPVLAAYDEAKALGDLLKTQFVGTLDLELPQRAEGDND